MDRGSNRVPLNQVLIDLNIALLILDAGIVNPGGVPFHEPKHDPQQRADQGYETRDHNLLFDGNSRALGHAAGESVDSSDAAQDEVKIQGQDFAVSDSGIDAVNDEH